MVYLRKCQLSYKVQVDLSVGATSSCTSKPSSDISKIQKYSKCTLYEITVLSL